MSEFYEFSGQEDNVRDWYMDAFEDDELGEEIREDIAFADVIEALDAGDDIYDFIGVADSVVRERVFFELSERMDVDYDVIYYKWLNND